AEPLPLALSAALADAFSEADLPWRVDVLDWATTSPSFRAIVQRDKVVVQKKLTAGQYHGNAMSEWQETKLGDICIKIGSGATPRGGSSVYLSEGVTLIRSQNVYNNRFEMQGLAFIEEKHALELLNVTVEVDDILLNITGDSVARTCQVPSEILPARVNQHVAIIRPSPNTVDARFLKYSLVNPTMQQYMLSIAGAGATRNALTKGMIENFKIPIPPLPIQRAIAHILGSLDDKIELNRRMNETLEAMARALFKDWFVDFGPVRAKMEGRQPPGLSAEIAALFPDALDTEGKPVGWRKSQIGDEVTVVGGSTPSTKDLVFWNGGTHYWTTPKDLSSLSSPILLYTERQITDAGLSQISSGLLPVGTVLLSSRAPIGYMAIAEIPTAINQGFIAMKCNQSLPNLFVLFWCKERMDLILGNANGSTFQEISKSNFRPIPVIVPSQNILDVFLETATPLFRQIVENLKESRTLAALRDLLLPKLLSGELRVRPPCDSRTTPDENSR
ncbi:MAG: restriction endonuclease subunit S, partial [Candidatus Uhrbacteria bacterium]